MQHASLTELESRLDEVRGAPRDGGTVELIARRPAEGEREILDEARLDLGEGLVGDRWTSPRGDPAYRDNQLTLMSARSAALVAGPRERWALAGDQLYVDLELSYGNLPPGTRLRIGSAVIEVTAEPHTGCAKFIRRFGADAQKFVNSAVGRELNLRGINTKVVAAGTVRQGDRIDKLADSGGQPEPAP
jgi:MOSC domain-containing protein YiiM